MTFPSFYTWGNSYEHPAALLGSGWIVSGRLKSHGGPPDAQQGCP